MLKTMIKMFEKTETVTDLKEVKSQTASKELNRNLSKALDLALEWIEKNNFVLKYNGEEVKKFKCYKLNESNLSQNRRKKIAKYIYYFMAKPTRKKLNSLLHIIWKTNGSEHKYRLYKSYKEQEIDKKREIFKDLVLQMKEAKKDFLEEKGDFYKKHL